MCKITAIANQKGGVGKTTVCQHLAYLMKEDGLRVLTVDFDPQANLTATLGPESTPPGILTISDLLERLLEEEDLPKSKEYLVKQSGVSLILGSLPPDDRGQHQGGHAHYLHGSHHAPLLFEL